MDVNTYSSHPRKDELQLTEGMARPAIPWIVLQAQMALLASLVAFPAEASPLLHDGLAQAVRQLLQKLQGGTCSQQDDGGGQDGASDAALQGLQAMAGALPPPPRVQCKPCVAGKASNGSRDLQAAAQRSQGSSATVQSHAHKPMPMRPRSENDPFVNTRRRPRGAATAGGTAAPAGAARSTATRFGGGCPAAGSIGAGGAGGAVPGQRGAAVGGPRGPQVRALKSTAFPLFMFGLDT